MKAVARQFELIVGPMAKLANSNHGILSTSERTSPAESAGRKSNTSFKPAAQHTIAPAVRSSVIGDQVLDARGRQKEACTLEGSCSFGEGFKVGGVAGAEVVDGVDVGDVGLNSVVFNHVRVRVLTVGLIGRKQTAREVHF